MTDIDPTSFGNAASDYATHRAGFPASLFDRLAGHGVGTPGQRALTRRMASKGPGYQ